MELTTNVIVRKTTHSKINTVDFSNLEFGKYISDHMLLCDYYAGEWQRPIVMPFADLSLSPSTLALHYGQTVFEGMKAFRTQDGRINIFRIKKHYERLVESLERMCMAIVPEEIFIEGLLQLLRLDQSWIPSEPGSSLYIRPFVYASEARIGVKVSEEYRLVIFTGPVAPYYSQPLKIKVETNFIRAAKGGTGYAKCGGNYGGAFYPTQLAKQEGFDQVLWTDGREHKYIEESGTMNVMFVINDVLITPPLSDTILDGVTRDSLLRLAADSGYRLEVRPIPISELQKAFHDKSISEAFGTGTAAVVAPIDLINISGTNYELPAYREESLHRRLKNKLEAIRRATEPDDHGWNYIL